LFLIKNTLKQLATAVFDSSSGLTTLDLLDVLESGILTLRAGKELSADACVMRSADCVKAESLHRQMDKAGITVLDFAAVFGIHPDMVQQWLFEKRPIPIWVPGAIQVFGLLPTSGRRKLLNIPEPHAVAAPARSHPFSRIKDL
jgi:hypothetical protein